MLSDVFKSRFHHSPAFLVRSPGRINLIGEHTDYNEGFVMPAAINRYVNVAIGKRDDDLIVLFAVQFNEYVEVSPSEIKPVEHSWTNYVLGVVDQLQKKGLKATGFNMAIDGDVPEGAGLSSSAAIECAVCFAIAKLFAHDLKKWDIALLSQKAEHTFPKVMCGIMDQFASTFGSKDHALKLDCRSLEYEELPLILKGYVILLLNTNVKHSLAATEYNTRRAECAKGISMINTHVPEVKSLRDANLPLLEKYVTDPLIFQRCSFIIEENERVNRAAQLLRAGDIVGLGKLMYGSHDGLSKKYEVSCPELDWLVDAVRTNTAVAGARMMGGGFGGCTINLVKEAEADDLVSKLTEGYGRAMNKELTAYIATTANGTEQYKE
jgi:galactokinase